MWEGDGELRRKMWLWKPAVVSLSTHCNHCSDCVDTATCVGDAALLVHEPAADCVSDPVACAFSTLG